jgi:hypothetical protein
MKDLREFNNLGEVENTPEPTRNGFNLMQDSLSLQNLQGYDLFRYVESDRNHKNLALLEASKYDLDVFAAHNLLRTNPKHFIPNLEEMLTRFDGNII